MAYHRQQGVDTAIVRIFNTYGPRMRPHDGRAIPTFLRQALHGPADHRLRRRQPDAQLLLRRRPDPRHDRAGRVRRSTSPVNIGNPDEFTLLELAETVIEVTGSRSEIVYEALPTDDPQVRQPDIDAAPSRSSAGSPQIDPARRPARTIDQAGRDILVGAGH